MSTSTSQIRSKCTRCAGTGEVNMTHPEFGHRCFACGGSGIVLKNKAVKKAERIPVVEKLIDWTFPNGTQGTRLAYFTIEGIEVVPDRKHIVVPNF